MTGAWRTVKSLPRWAWYGLASVIALLLTVIGLRSAARRLLPSRGARGSEALSPDTVEILSPKAAAKKREVIRGTLVERTETIDEKYDAEISDMEDWLSEDTTDPDSGAES